MFKKNYLVLSLVIAALLVSGCSSKKKKRRATPEGAVVFFQNIEGRAPLNLKAEGTNQRNSYGSVAFQQFTFAVTLPAGSWQVNAVENKTGDSQGEESVAKGAFSVEQNALSLVAITGNKDEAEVLQLPLAKRNGGRSINVSHLYKDLGDVDVYFETDADACEDDDFDNAEQIQGLAFGKTSESIKLPLTDTDNPDKNICVQIKQQDNVVYTSGKVFLDDKDNQALLLTKNTNTVVESTDPVINLIYYKQGEVAIWSDVEHQVAQVRVLNLLEGDLSEIEAGLLSDPAAVESFDDVDGTLTATQPKLSAYVNLETGKAYQLQAEKDGISLPAPVLMPLSGQQMTIAYYNDSAVKTMRINKVQNAVDGRLQLTISAPMFLASGEASHFNVYLHSDSEFEFNKPLVTLSANSSVTFDVEYKDYQLYITDAGESELVILRDMALVVDDSEEQDNKQIILYKQGGGFELCEINDEDQKCE